MFLDSYLLLTQAYFSFMVIIQSYGYVLLAANIDDFKSIAKKIVPEKLADQLAALASQSAINYKEKMISLKAKESDTEMYTDAKPEKKDNKKGLTNFDFDELVEKVKERLKKELYKKSIIFQHKQNIQNKNSKVKEMREKRPKDEEYSDSNVEQDKTVEYEKPKRYVQKRLNKINDNINSRDKIRNENYKKQHQGQKNKNIMINKLNKEIIKPLNTKREQYHDDNEEMTFSKIKMSSKNDSYEDYVTPEKEENVFDSGVEKLNERVSDTIITTHKSEPYTNIKTEDDKEYKLDEIKAKTEDLWYDYKSSIMTEDKENTTPITTSQKKQGTMIPKRDFYKMSSPNYYARVPIIAERYDFNEPIPEKDREPENLKPLPYLPSNINGRVRFNK